MSVPIATIVEATASAVGVASLIFYGGRWSERFDNLAKSVDNLSDTFDRFSEKITDKVSDIDIRVTVLESREKK